MQVGVLSDVHANRIALDAVIEDMPDVEGLVHAGDVVGYNPWPAECVEQLQSLDVVSVSGNHDRAVATGTGFRFNSMAQAGVQYAISSLDDEHVAWLTSLPDSRRAFDERVRVVHGHPDDPDRYTYPDDVEADLLGSESVLVLGHTHVQHVEHFDDGVVLNPGSVGQPRDGDPRAAYATVDLDDGSVDLHRVEYDVERVVEAVEDAGLPSRIGTRLRDGR